MGILLTPNPLVSQPKDEVRATIVARSVAHVTPLKQVQPVYPADAKAKGIQGLVRVKATIDREGVLGHFRVLKGPRALIPATLEALKQWRYRPFVMDGKAVEVEASFEINFVIPKKAPAESQKKPLTFQPTLAAQIVDTNAAKAGFSTHHFGSACFQASNGATLTVMYGFFKDADEAKRFLDWHARNAFKITSQETKTDMGGKAIEYRSELILEPEHSSIEVMWVAGNVARWITARDHEDALELERYYRQSLARNVGTDGT
jgi:TonB family protein